MKYLLLFNNDAEHLASWRQLPAEEAQRLQEQELPRWNALLDWMQQQGMDANGLRLDDPAKAKVVRVQDGETVVTDGPYAETKELIGGYCIADCKDLDAAIELAKRVPLVGRGSVEIRPLVTN
jgi:hypothetical protein